MFIKFNILFQQPIACSAFEEKIWGAVLHTTIHDSADYNVLHHQNLFLNWGTLWGFQYTIKYNGH
jgi:hypothetical protein